MMMTSQLPKLLRFRRNGPPKNGTQAAGTEASLGASSSATPSNAAARSGAVAGAAAKEAMATDRKAVRRATRTRRNFVVAVSSMYFVAFVFLVMVCGSAVSPGCRQSSRKTCWAGLTRPTGPHRKHQRLAGPHRHLLLPARAGRHHTGIGAGRGAYQLHRAQHRPPRLLPGRSVELL